MSYSSTVAIDQTGSNNNVSMTNSSMPVTQSGTWTIQPGNTANTTAWKVDGSAVTQPVSGTLTSNFATRADTYTGTVSGTTVDVSGRPMKMFSIQVKGTGASATTWDVRLEGSLDNVNFTQILQHTNTSGDGIVVFNGNGTSPALYIRSRCAGLVLGSASNIVVTILGVQ